MLKKSHGVCVCLRECVNVCHTRVTSFSINSVSVPLHRHSSKFPTISNNNKKKKAKTAEF